MEYFIVVRHLTCCFHIRKCHCDAVKEFYNRIVSVVTIWLLLPFECLEFGDDLFFLIQWLL